MKEILQSIQSKLSEIVELKHVDENWGQLDLFGSEIPVQWPVALIDISQASFDNIGRDLSMTPSQRQQGVIYFEIIVADLKLNNTSFRTSKLQKELGWKTWNLVQLVHNKLHGFSAVENAGALIRVGLSRTRRDDGIQEVKIIYSLALHNC